MCKQYEIFTADKIAKKIQLLCRPDVETDQDLHCSPLILFHITLNGVKPGHMLLFVLRFYGPVNQMGSCRARSVYLSIRLLGRLSSLSV